MKKTKLTGKVKKGIGKGAYFVSRPGYKKQFKQKLGFIPHPGTLNLKVNKDTLQKFLLTKKSIRIKGFKSNKKKFGKITAYKIKIKSIKGALLRPEKSKHKQNIIEIISPKNLRKCLNLKNEDKVRLH